MINRTTLADARHQSGAPADALALFREAAALPRGLLTRAWLRFVEGDPAGATADLDARPGGSPSAAR